MERGRKGGLSLREIDSVGGVAEIVAFISRWEYPRKVIIFISIRVFTMRWESGTCP